MAKSHDNSWEQKATIFLMQLRRAKKKFEQAQQTYLSDLKQLRDQHHKILQAKSLAIAKLQNKLEALYTSHQQNGEAVKFTAGTLALEENIERWEPAEDHEQALAILEQQYPNTIEIKKNINVSALEKVYEELNPEQRKNFPYRPVVTKNVVITTKIPR